MFSNLNLPCKPWLGFDEQLAKLQQRGLSVTDKAAALNYIERIGYYRLSGYWYSFRERSGKVCEIIYKGNKTQRTKETTFPFCVCCSEN